MKRTDAMKWKLLVSGKWENRGQGVNPSLVSGSMKLLIRIVSHNSSQITYIWDTHGMAVEAGAMWYHHILYEVKISRER